ncbi:sigma 54-interacting response regulator [Chitinophaga sp. CF418]|uniref:sigma 54-interacting response regulator n=1 Tax=Chitinophaga sp. CF418 TaxID=1855287 RepID=UPI0009212F21|nr:sigma 54-interacting response regulator [Chitinophaga sp. CF418]SHN35833.1 Transcriptional regulator containing GAF, AAA-type ATPase, and DNA-binding Fis domains [Chitinophaga sp. CF418]
MKKKILIVEDEFTVAYQLKSILEAAGHKVCGIAISVSKALALIDIHRPGLVMLDIHLKGAESGIELAHILNDKRIPFIYLSANSSESILSLAKETRPHGFLVKPFREKDLLVAIEIAIYRDENSLDLKEEQLAAVQAFLKKAANGQMEYEAQFAEVLQDIIPFDFLSAFTYDNGSWQLHDCGFLRIHFKEYQRNGLQQLSNISGLSVTALTQLSLTNVPVNTSSVFIGSGFSELAANSTLIGFVATNLRMESLFFQPLLMSDGTVIALCFFSKKSAPYSGEHTGMINFLRGLLEPAVETVCKADQASGKAVPENRRSSSGGQEEHFHGIVGRSSSLLAVFDYIKKVAARDTSVLVTGENGTGKERVARAIHQLSPRNNKPLVTVNCASLPPDLIESELFGHEKGAFTGAISQRTGKFEQASGGTIFLDEIGELPLNAQVKLLRVLQQREIDRVGGKAPVKVDIRVIAASNRQLEKEVAEGRFRMDLYYRLNVFPILLPPLRERTEDIPLLVEHFLNQHSLRVGGTPYTVSPVVIEHLQTYHWPGNVRELENIIERTVVLSPNRFIQSIVLPATVKTGNRPAHDAVQTIEEIERDHIIHVLRKCNRKIYGAGGAAQLLNLPPTTLTSKMKKLGISKDLIE